MLLERDSQAPARGFFLTVRLWHGSIYVSGGDTTPEMGRTKNKKK